MEQTKPHRSQSNARSYEGKAKADLSRYQPKQFTVAVNHEMNSDGFVRGSEALKPVCQSVKCMDTKVLLGI